jgi:hypothetical protein
MEQAYVRSRIDNDGRFTRRSESPARRTTRGERTTQLLAGVSARITVIDGEATATSLRRRHRSVKY